MKKFAGLLLLLWPLSAVAADEALPPAAGILDHFVDVTGGKANYQSHLTEVQTGRVEFAALGLKGTIVSYSSEPDRHYSKMELDAVGKVEMGVTGGVAWENNSISGPRIKTGAEREQAVRDARINAPYYWRQLYSKAATTGSEIVNGEDCYKVVLTPVGEGNQVTMYFGKKSGLMKKTAVIATSLQGDIPAETTVGEYREFSGVLIPTKMTEKAAGQEFNIIIENVDVNVQIPAERFELPAEIRALQK